VIIVIDPNYLRNWDYEMGKAKWENNKNGEEKGERRNLYIFVFPKHIYINKIFRFLNPNLNLRGWFGGCGQFECTGDYNILVHD